MRTMMTVATGLFVSAFSLSAGAAFPTFKVQEIDKTLKVGYGLRIVDLNADGKLDIVVADANRVIWFDQAADWKLNTVIDNAKAGVKADNVCLDVHDIDGDGKLDIALGADWQINNTAAGGSLQWLRQGKTIDEWTVHKIAESIPTLHRIHFADLEGDGKVELLVGPIRGRRSTARENFMDQPLQLLAYKLPANPAGAWGEPAVINESLHHLHNFTPFDQDGDKAVEILTASSEGVGGLTRDGEGKRIWTRAGAGFPGEPKSPKGSSEVKVGKENGRTRYVVAIEPLHGHQIVTYTSGGPAIGSEPEQPSQQKTERKPELFARSVVDDQLKAGHALWCADLDGDGLDEIIAGFRDATSPGVYPGVNVYKASGIEDPMKWEKHVIDDKSMATEDLACADLNGDGKIDIVAVGRATGNVRIYWNEGVAEKK